MSHGFLFHPSKLSHKDLLFSLSVSFLEKTRPVVPNSGLLFEFVFEYVIYYVLHLTKHIRQSASFITHPHFMQKAVLIQK